MTVVSFHLNVKDQHFAPVTSAPFPLSTEWTQTTRLSYRIDKQGVCRYKRDPK